MTRLRAGGRETPFLCAPSHPHRALTWLVIALAGCDVGRPDITTKSHLRLVPWFALDTRRRNGHASDQAQVTVLRTLVRSRDSLAGDASRLRVEVL
jgi:hypothetical protein